MIVFSGDAQYKDPTVVTGADVFVFAPNNGQDTVNDFEQGKDHIGLTADAAIGIHQFSDLNIQTVGANSVIHIDANDDITVVGDDHLTAADFYFNGSNASTVSDASPAANIALLGQYTAASFVVPADGSGGTLIHEQPPATLTQTLTPPQHA